MGRIRTIKPEFPLSESVGRLSREARLFFIQLWTICDDEGRTRAASRMLASLLYPYDDDAAPLIDGWIAEAERQGCITRYVVDGAHYIQVCNWLNHQKIDRPSKSRLPSFDEGSRIVANDSRNLDADLVPRTLDLGKELPTTSGEETPADPIFGTGLDFLKRKGLPEKPARSFLGLLRKELHDDLTVAELLVEAERQDVSAPQAWLREAAKQRKQTGGSNGNGRSSRSQGYESVADRASRFAREGNEADARRAAANRSDASVVGEDGGDLRASVG